MANTIGSVVVEVAASTAKFETDIARVARTAEKHMSDIDKAVAMVKTSFLSIAGVVSVGFALEQIKRGIEGAIVAAADLQDVSEKTGATVESLSGLASMARLSGTNITDLATGLQKLSKSTVDAQNGGKQTAAAFKALGISIESLKGKGPEDIFKTIALQMEMYKDGVEKTTLSQVLFGKSGANLLPVLKDVANAGEYQVRTTTAQAEAADELLKNQVKLQASYEDTYKVIAMALVPVMNDFVLALLQTQSKTEGLKKTVNDLAADNSIRDWAQNMALSFAVVYEAVVGVSKVVYALGGSFQSVAADAMVALEFIKVTAQDIGTFGKGDATGLDAARANREKVAIDANNRYKALLEDGTRLSTELAKRFAATNKAAADAAANGNADVKKPKPTLDVTGLGNANIFKDDKYKKMLEGQIKALEDQVAAEGKLLKYREKLLDYYNGLQVINLRETETAKQFFITEGLKNTQQAYDQEIKIAEDSMKRKGATQVQITTAENIRADATRKRLSAEIEADKQITESKLKLDAIAARFALATADKLRVNTLANDAAQFQIAMLGKETLEVAKLTAARQIQLDLEERIRLLKLQDPTVSTAKAIADAAIQTSKATSLIELAYEKQRTGAFGASEALRKYQVDATNMASQVESVMANSFKGMEDALVKFVTTGKLSFTDLANSIVADITRVILKQMIMNSIGGGSGGAGFLSSLVGSGMGAMFGTSGTAAVASSMPGDSLSNMMSLTGGFGTVPLASGGIANANGLYQVNERGPEMFSSNGKQYLMVGSQGGLVAQTGASGQSVSVVNNFTLNAPADRRTQSQIASSAGQSVQRAMARNS